VLIFEAVSLFQQRSAGAMASASDGELFMKDGRFVVGR